MRSMLIIILTILFVLALCFAVKVRSQEKEKVEYKEIAGFIYDICFDDSEIIVVTVTGKKDEQGLPVPFYTGVKFKLKTLVLLKEKTYLVLPGKEPSLVVFNAKYNIVDKNGKTFVIKNGDSMNWLINSETNEFISIQAPKVKKQKYKKNIKGLELQALGFSLYPEERFRILSSGLSFY